MNIYVIKKKTLKMFDLNLLLIILPNNTFINSTISLTGFTLKYSIKFNKIRCWTNYSEKENPMNLNKNLSIIK